MKKYFLFITGIILPSLFLTAQDTTSPKALTIGDRVPDFYFETMLNYKTNAARLSDFKDKVVILDFWATWCPPCVAGLPHLSSLQQEFKNDIIVMPINEGLFQDTKPYVTSFLQKKKDIRLPTYYGDSAKLNDYLPHDGIPYCVVIGKDRVVKALTKSSYITKEYLQALIAGENVSLPVDTTQSLNYDRPLSFIPAFVKAIDYSCQISGFLEGYRGFPQERTDRTTRIAFVNQPVITLYAFAFEQLDYVRNGRIAFSNARDSALLSMPPGSERQQDEWLAQNSYCIELTVPKALTDRRFELMKKELDNYFGAKFNIHPHMEKRRMRCLKLVATQDTSAIRIKSAEQLAILERGGGYSIPVLDVSMHDWLQMLNDNMKTIPVINGSGYNGNISLGMNAKDGDYLKELKKAVQKIGLRIEETEDDVEVIVF